MNDSYLDKSLLRFFSTHVNGADSSYIYSSLITILIHVDILRTEKELPRVCVITIYIDLLEQIPFFTIFHHYGGTNNNNNDNCSDY